MSILVLIGVVLTAGLAVWAINNLPIIAPAFKQIAYVLIVVVVVVYILSAIGILPHDIRIGR